MCAHKAQRLGRKVSPLNSDEQVEMSEQNADALASENVEETGEAQEVEREGGCAGGRGDG